MRLLAAIGLVVGLTGCVTPSIPIPPPDPSSMTFRVSGAGTPDAKASFSYLPDANYSEATVFVFNRDRGEGIITTATIDGSVDETPPVRADLGEQIVVTFERDDQTVSTCIRLRDGAQSATDYCSP
jgi:hypothetical protein